jgi:O-antigen ligase
MHIEFKVSRFDEKSFQYRALTKAQIFTFAGIFFFAPSSVAGMNISGALFTILSTLRLIAYGCNRKESLTTIYLVVIFAAWIALTGLWSPNWHDYVTAVRSLWWYVLLPLGVLSISWDENKFKIIIYAFILGISTNALLFVLQLTQLVPGFYYNAKFGLVGFGNRVYLSMLVPAAIILLIKDTQEKYIFKNPLVSAAIAMLLAFELIWSTGRTAQLMFLLLVLLFFHRAIIKSKAALFFSIAIAIISIKIAPHMIGRWDEAINDIRLYRTGDVSTDFGLRFAFWDASIKTFLAHPIIGVGAGGYTSSFFELMRAKEIPTITQNWYWAIEPHNSYLAVLAEYGMAGFILFLSLLVKFYTDSKNEKQTQLKRFKLIILLSFVLASFSDAFVWRWQGMMILLATFAISFDSGINKNVQYPNSDLE